MAYLRSICQKVGVQVEARSYDFSLEAPFVFSDIIDIFPIVKHMSPKVCLFSLYSLPLPLLFVLLAEIKNRAWMDKNFRMQGNRCSFKVVLVS